MDSMDRNHRYWWPSKPSDEKSAARRFLWAVVGVVVFVAVKHALDWF